MKRITIGLIICAAFFSAACSNQQSANTENTKMEKTENKTENTIFPEGRKSSGGKFYGNGLRAAARS